MVKIAIVGPEESKWTEEQKAKAKAEISKIFFKWLKGYHFEEYDYSGFPGFKTKYDFEDITLVSGHCPKGGIDLYAEEMADELGIQKEIYPAEVNQWEDVVNYDKGFPKNGIISISRMKGYKSRNIQIAEACNILYCIVPKRYVDAGPSAESDYCKHCKEWGHPTNGGCFTLEWTKKLNKETHLIVIE